MSKNELKLVSQTLRKIAIIMEKEPKFLEDLERWLEKYEASSKKKSIGDHDKDTPVDIFNVYSKEGKDGLASTLKALELPELRKIIISNNLDPSKLSHKWKDKEKIINLILERTAARSNKGRAFINYGQN